MWVRGEGDGSKEGRLENKRKGLRCSASDMTLLYQPQGTKEENTKEQMGVCAGMSWEHGGSS